MARSCPTEIGDHVADSAVAVTKPEQNRAPTRSARTALRPQRQKTPVAAETPTVTTVRLLPGALVTMGPARNLANAAQGSAVMDAISWIPAKHATGMLRQNTTVRMGQDVVPTYM